MKGIEVLPLACAFEMKVPEPRSPEVQQLIVTINEQLWIGHFDVWMESGMVMFCHALLLLAGAATFCGAHRRVHARPDARRADLVIAHFLAVCCPHSGRNQL